MAYSYRPSRGDEPSGLICITAEGWMIRLYGGLASKIAASGGADPRGLSAMAAAQGTPAPWSDPTVYWEVRSPDRHSVKGGAAPNLVAAGRDASGGLKVRRDELARSNAPARVAAFAAWRAETDAWLESLRQRPGPSKPSRD